MAQNSFGKNFCITTFGESHGEMIGVVIDGCPSNIDVCENEINAYLALRKPGKNNFVSPRKEEDKVKIVSGVFLGKTTGMPLTMIIENKKKDSSKYEGNKDLLRPGHANYVYQEKYEIFDYRGGGRASARETVGRVAAAAVAEKILQKYKISATAFLNSVGDLNCNEKYWQMLVENKKIKIQEIKEKIKKSNVFCPDEKAEEKVKEHLQKVQKAGDSIGGTVGFCINGLPLGLGEPVYEKFSAKLAQAMFSIPAVRGFEIGQGFKLAKMLGSQSNDIFINEKTKNNVDGKIKMETNNTGGVLAGITTGECVYGKVAFKPTASIAKVQRTLDFQGKEKKLVLPAGSCHDVCVAVRGAIVVEAMCILVVADSLLEGNFKK